MIRYNLFFTLDYEIHGNGEGDPYALMVEPTYKLMSLLESYGQRLIIMADVAEILCFRCYWKQTGKDDFHVAAIERQLCDAILRGHDVQLHIHSSYFKAVWDGRHFDQCIEEYNMASLPYERIDEMVEQCVDYLENLIRQVKSDYKVWLFRAANWSMMPTPNLYKALVKYGITHDTSVYKGGCQGGNVCYDYRNAYDNLLSYPASSLDINKYDQEGKIIELPIYTEMRPFWNFISIIRIYRMIRAKFHKHKKADKSLQINKTNAEDNRKLSIKSFFRLSPWKLDFNQATGSQLIGAIKRIKKRDIIDRDAVDIVLIGHSKSFIAHNKKTLESFLRWYTS